MGYFGNLYVLEEVLIVDLEVSVFEFPCLKVRSEMRRAVPLPHMDSHLPPRCSVLCENRIYKPVSSDHEGWNTCSTVGQN